MENSSESQPTPSRETDWHFRAWPLFFLLSTLEGLAALIYLASISSDTDTGLVLSYSANRLALMLVALIPIFFFGLITVKSWRDLEWRKKWFTPENHPKIFKTILILAPFGILISWLVLEILHALYHTTGNFSLYAYYERLFPLLLWAGLICLQSLVWLSGFSEIADWKRLVTARNTLRLALIAWLFFLAVGVIIAFTRIGIVPDAVSWGLPTVPLLEWQIWLSWAAGCVYLLYLLRKRGRKPQSTGNESEKAITREDWLLMAGLWLLAVLIWLSQPVPQGYFATPGRPPNYEIYPFSDGSYYGHYAQSILIGNGFMQNQVPPRPLYILFLAVAHAIAGQSYNNVIIVQTLVLAFIPVALYLLGKRLHSRPAGLMIGLLAILRELTSIQSTLFTDDTSNSKLFFADLPATLMICLFTLFVIIWLQSPSKNRLLPLISGGALGVTMLVRTQSLMLLPLVLVAAAIAYGISRWRILIIDAILLFAGLTLAVAPWLWRNYQITGQIMFDDPESQTSLVAGRYSLGSNTNIGQYPDESNSAYYYRLNQLIIQTIKSNPGSVAQFISAHFLNSEIDNVLVLPVRYNLNSLGELFIPKSAFWEEWNGNLSPVQAGLILLNLGVIALGIGASLKRYGVVGLIPLFINVSYNLSNAVGRNSGWRYLLPADWVSYFYFAIGLMEIFILLFSVINSTVQIDKVITPARKITEIASIRRQFPVRKACFTGLAILLLGSSLPLAEKLVPKRYPSLSAKEIISEIQSQPTYKALHIDSTTLNELVSASTVVINGRGIYPRYYAAGDGEPRTARTGYAPLDYQRLVFLTVGETNQLVILKTQNQPGFFPNTADILMLGCQQSNYIQGILVSVLDKPGATYFDPGAIAACKKKS
jgi:hypothetical protein